MGIKLPFAPLLRRRTADRKAFQDFNRSLLLIVDPEALQASIAARLRELFGPDRILILQLDSQKGVFSPTYSSGFEDGAISEIPRLRRHGRLAKWLLVNETYLIVPRASGIHDYLSETERAFLAGHNIRICVPLLSLNRLTGIIMLGSRRRQWNLGPKDLELLQLLAGQAGLAFENAYLYREQRERLRRIYRAERLASAGQLAAGVAHEIRNPLTAIRSTIQYVVRDHSESDPRKALLEELLSEVDRIDRTVAGLLSLTRPEEFVPEPIDVVEVLGHSLLLIEAQAQRQGVTIVRPDAGRRFRIMGDAGQLKQVFLNILLNALQATGRGGRIEVLVDERVIDLAPATGRWAEIEFRDSGSGIPSDLLDRIFDPFFTTKRDGTGLGLSVCHEIVRQHDGEIDIRSEQGKGTRVTVQFPLL